MSEWKLIFEENFAGDSLNPQRWNINEVEGVRNQELQYYHPIM